MLRDRLWIHATCLADGHKRHTERTASLRPRAAGPGTAQMSGAGRYWGTGSFNSGTLSLSYRCICIQHLLSPWGGVGRGLVVLEGALPCQLANHWPCGLQAAGLRDKDQSTARMHACARETVLRVQPHSHSLGIESRLHPGHVPACTANQSQDQPDPCHQPNRLPRHLKERGVGGNELHRHVAQTLVLC